MNAFCMELQGGCWEKAPWKPEPRSTQLCLCLLTPPQEMQLFCMAGISAQNFQHPHKSVTKASSSTHSLGGNGGKRELWSISVSEEMPGRPQLMREVKETVPRTNLLKKMSQSKCQHPGSWRLKQSFTVILGSYNLIDSPSCKKKILIYYWAITYKINYTSLMFSFYILYNW